MVCGKGVSVDDTVGVAEGTGSAVDVAVAVVTGGVVGAVVSVAEGPATAAAVSAAVGAVCPVGAHAANIKNPATHHPDFRLLVSLCNMTSLPGSYKKQNPQA